MAIDIRVVTRQFQNNLLRYQNYAGKAMQEATAEAAVLFAASAARNTPPAMGKAIPRRLFKREMYQVEYAQVGNLKIYRPKDRQWQRKNRNVASEWQVIERKYRNGRRSRRVLSFRSAAEARRHRMIDYRGVSRAGWWASILRLGATPPRQQYGSKVEGVLPRINRTRRTLVPLGGAIRISNTVRGIERYAQLSAKIGLARAGNRLRFLANRAKKELEGARGGRI